jgi:hypothetical protein
MQHKYEWILYLLGALLCLVWKWQRFCYESKGRGLPFWKASRAWFELVTFGSRISWAVTIGFVWVIGVVYIERVGVDWMFDGLFSRIPVHISFAFLIGALAELTAPAAAKWIASKIPFADPNN